MLQIEDKILTQEYRCFKNVSDYSCVEGEAFHWKILCEQECLPEKESADVYFILETQSHEAFSHWVYEDAIWIPLYLDLKKIYSNCRLVIEKMKDFKKIFLDKYNISPRDIKLRSEINSTNYCFFHTYISLNDITLPETFFKKFSSYLNFIDGEEEKSIPILYLPRGVKENFQGPNNRVYNVQNKLKELVIDLGGVIYETDMPHTLDEQISIVRRSKLIILDYGSNLWVNGCFAKDSMIITLNIGWQQHDIFPSIKCLWDYINSKNFLTQIFAKYTESTLNDGTPFIFFDFEEIKKILLCLYNTSED